MRQPLYIVNPHMKRVSLLYNPFHWRKKTYYSPRYLQLLKPYLRDSVRTLSNDILEKQSDDSKIASANTTDQAVDKPTSISEIFFTDRHITNDISLIPLGKRSHNL